MDEMLTVLLDIVSRLEEKKLPYMVSGSMARNLYTEPRFTNDIDIVLDIYPKQKSIILAIFQKDYYISDKQIEDAFINIGFFNIIHLEKSIKCDFILRKKDEFTDQCFQRRTKESINNQLVYFISKEDLILQKLHWRKSSRSEQQLQDVIRIIENQELELDKDYLLDWSKKLQVYNDLKELL